MQKMSLKKLNELLLGRQRALLFVKSESCELCHQFESIIGFLEDKYINNIEFFVASGEQEGVVEVLEKEINGVPSIILFKPTGYLVVPDPDEPDPDTWYTREYIEKFLKEW